MVLGARPAGRPSLFFPCAPRLHRARSNEKQDIIDTFPDMRELPRHHALRARDDDA